jgi:hypothetical protein
VTRDYRIEDSGSRVLLEQAARALDRAEECSAVIAADGYMVNTGNGGVRDHPLIKHELAARSFVTRTLLRIGVVEARAVIGRPPKGGLGVGPEFRARVTNAYERLELEGSNGKG